MSPYQNQFINFKSISPHPIKAADKRTFNAISKGDLQIEVPNGKMNTHILLHDMLYAPSMGVTLISISQLTKTRYAVLFRENVCKIYDAQKKQVGEIPLVNGLFQVKRHHSKIFAGAARANKTMSMDELHCRLSHITPLLIQEIMAKGMVEGVKLDPEQQHMGQCESCEYAKATWWPIGKEHEPKHCKNLGDEVHSDLWGPSPVQTPSGKSYYVLFTDDHTHYTHLYLQPAKSNTFKLYKTCKSWLKTQHNATIKCLQSDRGGEYLSDEFSHHLRMKGTERKLTTHDTPQHNSVAKRLNCTLVECVRAILHASKLPKNLWGEAVMHAVYVKNRTATRSLDGKTPYEMLYGKKLNVKDLPVWGTRVWVHNTSRLKLDMRVHEGRWIRFDPESNGHQIYFEDCRNIAIKQNISFEKPKGLVLSQEGLPLEGESKSTSNS